MASSRDLTLIDKLVSVIETAWAPSAPDSVSREYIAPVTLNDLKNFTGRRVYFFPAAYETEDENRSENKYGYHVEACILERYEDIGKATDEAVKDWLDGLLDWVETYFIDGLDYGQGHSLLVLGSREFWTETIEVATRYDIDLLNEKKIFRSNIGYVFREIKA